MPAWRPRRWPQEGPYGPVRSRTARLQRVGSPDPGRSRWAARTATCTRHGFGTGRTRADRPYRRPECALTGPPIAEVGGAAAGAVSAHAMDTGTARDQAERRQVSAVLLETAPTGVRDPSTGATYDHVWAKVRWTDRDGTVRTDSASVKTGAKVGTAVSVWTDGHEQLVSAPIGPAEAAARVVLTGTGVASAGGLMILAGGHAVRLRIERGLPAARLVCRPGLDEPGATPTRSCRPVSRTDSGGCWKRLWTPW